MTKQMNYDEPYIFNQILDALRPQKISVSSASAKATNAIKGSVIVVYCTVATWIRFDSSDPTAVANDGTSVYHPANFIRAYKVIPGNKIAAIRDVSDGELHLTEGA